MEPAWWTAIGTVLGTFILLCGLLVTLHQQNRKARQEQQLGEARWRKKQRRRYKNLVDNQQHLHDCIENLKNEVRGAAHRRRVEDQQVLANHNGR